MNDEVYRCMKCDIIIARYPFGFGDGQLLPNYCEDCKMTQEEDKKRLKQLTNRLYYIEHKDEVNSKRKKYKRQSWADRKDNPKNKEKV